MIRFLFRIYNLLKNSFNELLESPTLIVWLLFCFDYINGYILILLVISNELKEFKLKQEVNKNSLEIFDLKWDLQEANEEDDDY